MVIIKLQRLLDKKDMSQRKLSRLTGIRIGTIGMYCNNQIKRMQKDDIDRICNALNCKIEDLMEHIPDKKD